MRAHRQIRAGLPRTAVVWVVVLLGLTAPPDVAAQDEPEPVMDVLRTADGAVPPEDVGTAIGHVVDDAGRIVAFTTSVGGVLNDQPDDNDASDVYIWDRADGRTRLISTATGSDAAADGPATNPRISRDGRYVFYLSDSTNGAPQPNTRDDGSRLGTMLLRYEVDRGTTELVTRSVDDRRACGQVNSNESVFGARAPFAIADDGSAVAFTARCPDLVYPAEDTTAWFNDELYLWREGRGVDWLSEGIPAPTAQDPHVGSGVPHVVRGISSDGTVVTFSAQTSGQRWQAFDRSAFEETANFFLYTWRAGLIEPVFFNNDLSPVGSSFHAMALAGDGRTWAVIPREASQRCGPTPAVCVRRGDSIAADVGPIDLPGPLSESGIALARNGAGLVLETIGERSDSAAWFHDLETGENILVTRTPDGDPVDTLQPTELVGFNQRDRAVVSDDGTAVVFRGDPARFGFGNPDEPFSRPEGSADLFVFDVPTRTVGLVAQPGTASTGGFVHISSSAQVVTGSGEVVVFLSSKQLNDDDTDDGVDLYAWGGPVELPDPDPVVEAIEVNQGIQTRVARAGAIDSIVDYPDQDVPFVVGRDTLVRLYPFAGEGADPAVYDVDLRLQVELDIAPGVLPPQVVLETTSVIRPNVFGEPRPVVGPADAELDRQLLVMRSDPTRTVEFVLDGDAVLSEGEVVGADLVPRELIRGMWLTPWHEFEDRAVGGTVRVDLQPAEDLRVQLLNFTGPHFRGLTDEFGRPGTNADIGRFRREVVPYLERTTPFAGVAVASATDVVLQDPSRPFRARGADGRVRQLAPANDCLRALHLAALAAAGNVAPTAPADYTVTLGYGTTFRACFGLAYGFDGARLGASAATRYGNGWPMVTASLGDSAAHELGHTMGIRHADGSHREADAEAWPYGRGWINPPTSGPEQQAFGALMTDLSGQLIATPLGTAVLSNSWTASVLDFCPATGERTAPCTNGDAQQGAELMSYGSSPPAVDLSPLVTTVRDRWPSDLTWRRMVAAMGGLPATTPFPPSSPAPEASAPASRQAPPGADGVLVVSVLEQDGERFLLPADHVSGRGAVVEAEADDLVVEARDADGGVLAAAPVIEGVQEEAEAVLHVAVLPAMADVTSLVLVEDGVDAIAWPASANAPTVSLTAPGTVTADRATVELVIYDDDADDVLGATLSISVDGGETWSVLRHLDPAETGPATIDLSGFPTGPAILRAAVSDGLLVDIADADLVIGPLRRLSGDSRVATAIEVSRASHPEDGSAATAVLARADGFADALSGATLATQVAGPLLLNPTDRLADEVAAELTRLDVDEVVLLGGVSALSAQVAADLGAMGVTVERVAGDSRFATAGAVADRIDSAHAFLVEGANADPGRGWPDAVSASALAAFGGDPVFLATRDELPAATAEALIRNGIGGVTIVGGTAAVGDAVAAALTDLGIAVERVAGPSRFATSGEVAALAEQLGADGNRVWLATGSNFPDALAAGPAAAADGGLLLLVDRATLDGSPAVGEWIEDHPDLSQVTLVGGTAAISDQVAAELEARAG
ncbi:MAG: cell wall-binding repeat-containing protein [Actinomycetota bacterium]